MAGTKQFDPLAYIEDAFLDQSGKKKGKSADRKSVV